MEDLNADHVIVTATVLRHGPTRLVAIGIRGPSRKFESRSNCVGRMIEAIVSLNGTYSD